VAVVHGLMRRWALALVCALLSVPAFAATDTVTQGKVFGRSDTSLGTWYRATGQGACSEWASRYTAYSGQATTATYDNVNNCTFGPPVNATIVLNLTYVCPNGNTFDLATGGCVGPVTNACTPFKGQTFWQTGAGSQKPGATVCAVNNCQATISSGVVNVTNNATGAKSWEAEATYTDVVCSYAAATPTSSTGSGTPTVAQATPDSCVGGGYAQMNGVTVCVPNDPRTTTTATTSTTSGTTTSTVTPSGGTAGTPTTATTDKTSTATCDGTQCTVITSTTAKDPSTGSVTKSDSTEVKPQADYCKDNPKAVQCKDTQNSFSGSCSAGFNGEGDVATVAIAKAVWETKCKFFDTTSAESDLYTASKSAGTGLNTETFAISATSFDQSNPLGAASCVPDKTIVVMTKTIVLPFSSICTHLATLGTILTSVSWLLAFAIVARGVT
jgi:hypothetical protein